MIGYDVNLLCEYLATWRPCG